jgi:hypothetical protein
MNIPHDPVTAPAHYTVYPVQPIAIARHLPFCLGNAVKYIMRAPYKGREEDILKARQYLQWDIETPGPAVPHHVYLRTEACIEALVDNFSLPGSAVSDLQASFLISLDAYLDTGNRACLADMLDAVRRMLNLPELQP